MVELIATLLLGSGVCVFLYLMWIHRKRIHFDTETLLWTVQLFGLSMVWWVVLIIILNTDYRV